MPNILGDTPTFTNSWQLFSLFALPKKLNEQKYKICMTLHHPKLKMDSHCLYQYVILSSSELWFVGTWKRSWQPHNAVVFQSLHKVAFGHQTSFSKCKCRMYLWLQSPKWGYYWYEWLCESSVCICVKKDCIELLMNTVCTELFLFCSGRRKGRWCTSRVKLGIFQIFWLAKPKMFAITALLADFFTPGLLIEVSWP